MSPKEYAKAIIAAILAGLAALATALTDNTITPVEWIMVATAVLTAGAAVFGIPNAAPAVDDGAPEHRAE
jgi:hypothetical protein